MSTGYRFGRKGQERVVADYWEALEAILSMPIPTFRRPNSVGNFGGVVCKKDDVEDVSKNSIILQLNPSEK